MLRLLAFFCATFVLLILLRQVPFLGALFQIPFLGFFLAAILLSALAARFATLGLERRRLKRSIAQLGAVDTPHNQGKLGSLLLASGDLRKASECLARAVAGEPESIEWHYRYGLALLRSGNPTGAAGELAQVVQKNEDYAYGEALLRLAEAQQAAGRPQEVLATLERHERAQGAIPEALYRRALALRALGRGDEARTALAGVGEVAGKRARFQKRGDTKWVMLAWLRRVA